MKRYKPSQEDRAMLETMNTGKRKGWKYYLLCVFFNAIFFVGFILIGLAFIDALPDGRY